MRSEIPEADYRAIEELIASDESPVGIDAKKTHVLILHKLMSIEARLDRLERATGEATRRSPAGSSGPAGRRASS